ncbi:MAG: hypothetical protein MUC88_09810 [Planctomycetes bacterium]|nr:hypothetical protein [Planctomycetota bacterium]
MEGRLAPRTSEQLAADGKKHAVVIVTAGPVVFEKCAFKDMTFQVNPAANLRIVDCTLDGKPLTLEQIQDVRRKTLKTTSRR